MQTELISWSFPAGFLKLGLNFLPHLWCNCWFNILRSVLHPISLSFYIDTLLSRHLVCLITPGDLFQSCALIYALTCWVVFLNPSIKRSYCSLRCRFVDLRLHTLTSWEILVIHESLISTATVFTLHFGCVQSVRYLLQCWHFYHTFPETFPLINVDTFCKIIPHECFSKSCSFS